MNSASEVQVLRGQLWQNGFPPVAVYSPDAKDWKGQPIVKVGKRPKGDGWEIRARQNPPEASSKWPESDAMNTGILCDGLQGVDIIFRRRID